MSSLVSRDTTLHTYIQHIYIIQYTGYTLNTYKHHGRVYTADFYYKMIVVIQEREKCPQKGTENSNYNLLKGTVIYITIFKYLYTLHIIFINKL